MQTLSPNEKSILSMIDAGKTRQEICVEAENIGMDVVQVGEALQGLCEKGSVDEEWTSFMKLLEAPWVAE